MQCLFSGRAYAVVCLLGAVLRLSFSSRLAADRLTGPPSRDLRLLQLEKQTGKKLYSLPEDNTLSISVAQTLMSSNKGFCYSRLFRLAGESGPAGGSVDQGEYITYCCGSTSPVQW